MAQPGKTLIAKIISACVALSIFAALCGCVKQTSDDSAILNDAGTSSGAAIILDPDESSSSR